MQAPTKGDFINFYAKTIFDIGRETPTSNVQKEKTAPRYEIKPEAATFNVINSGTISV